MTPRKLLTRALTATVDRFDRARVRSVGSVGQGPAVTFEPPAPFPSAFVLGQHTRPTADGPGICEGSHINTSEPELWSTHVVCPVCHRGIPVRLRSEVGAR